MLTIIDHQLLSVVVRWLHVGAMACAFGGALLLWALNTRIRFWDTLDAPTRLSIAEAYEFLFWGAAGILVMTGVGNLGALGQSLPNPDSAWGNKLMLKLAFVLLLILFSLARTLFVARLRASELFARSRILQLAYVTTALGLMLVLFVAVSLAHG